MYVCMYVYMYTCMYACMYVWEEKKIIFNLNIRRAAVYYGPCRGGVADYRGCG